ncbi:MAG: hypothetical protein Ct9H300mP22_6530 [Gammaproteobacteria bacterium]|nr:MAG: hypothetical protein Ct9H300mP22_6530 [Gammaproteobacteria bacterium]
MNPIVCLPSRAEYRLTLREDNADLRLTEIGYQLGIVSEKRLQLLNEKQERIELELNRLRNTGTTKHRYCRPGKSTARKSDFP